MKILNKTVGSLMSDVKTYFGRPDALNDALSSQISDGSFWADLRFGEDHLARFENAIKYLPLPGAFREASIALRAMIRQKRKEKSNYAEELSALYWMGAVASFVAGYSKEAEASNFNIFSQFDEATISGLNVSYKNLGYQYLLHGKTDVKWLIESWGEPDAHRCIIDAHRDVWARYERLHVAKYGRGTRYGAEETYHSHQQEKYLAHAIEMSAKKSRPGEPISIEGKVNMPASDQLSPEHQKIVATVLISILFLVFGFFWLRNYSILFKGD